MTTWMQALRGPIRMLVRKLLAAYRVVQYYLLTSTCRGFEWSGLGKNSPYPKKYGVSEYHADGNRYRCMGLAFTHWLDMAVTALRTPVSGLPFLFRGHSYQLSFKQIPVALSRSYGGVPSGLPAPGAEVGWVLSPTWFAANFGLQSCVKNTKATYCCAWLLSPVVPEADA